MSLSKNYVIIGSPGAGKTTLAKQLGEHLNLQAIEMDYYHFTHNWVEVSDETFFNSIDLLTQQSGWIADGNYGILRNMLWKRAEVLIWLRFPFFFTFRRLFVRSMDRVFSQKPLWHGNKESFYNTFFTKNSIFYWFFKTYRQRNRQYEQLLKSSEYSHLRVMVITNPNNVLEQVLTRLNHF